MVIDVVEQTLLLHPSLHISRLPRSLCHHELQGHGIGWVLLRPELCSDPVMVRLKGRRKMVPLTVAPSRLNKQNCNSVPCAHRVFIAWNATLSH